MIMINYNDSQNNINMNREITTDLVAINNINILLLVPEKLKEFIDKYNLKLI